MGPVFTVPIAVYSIGTSSGQDVYAAKNGVVYGRDKKKTGDSVSGRFDGKSAGCCYGGL